MSWPCANVLDPENQTVRGVDYTKWRMRNGEQCVATLRKSEHPEASQNIGISSVISSFGEMTSYLVLCLGFCGRDNADLKCRAPPAGNLCSVIRQTKYPVE